LHVPAAISFAAWVRCDDITRDAPILAKEGEGRLSYWFGTFGVNYNGAGPGNFGVLLSDNGNQPWTVQDRDQGSIPQGDWVHLASTWDGTTIRHYLNGEPLSETRTFAGPLRYSDAFLAIGVNSLYTFAANDTAFEGAIDDVRLYNYALGPDDIRVLYQESVFRITAVKPEGPHLRLNWACIPGRSYVIQTSTLAGVAGHVEFTDISAPIEVPMDYIRLTIDYVHTNGLASAGSLFYRVKLLP